MKHYAGFVNIIGSPNVGKSTLMNELVGEKLSIITNKAQTTRHRIMGMVNGDDYQIVYSDTPGILKPSYKMHEGMMQFVNTAIKDADILLVMTEVGETKVKEPSIEEKIKNAEIPVLLLVNKIDLVTQDELDKIVDNWAQTFPNADILPMSALNKTHTDLVHKWIRSRLPESPPFYDKDALTDKPERFFVTEIIREKILKFYSKEIPYSVEVEIEEFKESKDIIKIRALIYVARESQKAIIIGHQGKALKKVGTESRKDIEKFFDKKVFLQTFVKVKKNWRDDDKDLKKFGYL